MLYTALYNIGIYLMNVLLNVLPDSDGFPPEVHTASQYLGGYLNMLDPLVPISTLGTAVGVVVTIELAIFTFKTVKWLLAFVPFVGGKA